MARDRTFTKNTLVIPNGASASNSLGLGVEVIGGIVAPSGWDAAVLAFEASIDGGATWLPVVDEAGVEITIASAGIVAAAGRMIVGTTVDKLRGLAMVRLQSGPVGARVNQTAARTFGVASKTP